MKNLLKISMFLLLSAVILISACNKKDDPDPDPQPTYEIFTFVKTGNYWDYYTYAASVLDDSMKMKVTSSLGAGKWQIVMEPLAPPIYGDTSIWYMTDVEFGFWDAVKTTVLKADAKVNDKYVTIDSGDTLTYKVVGIDVTTIVPAGSFKCFKVAEYYGSDLGGYLYINPKSGLILYEDVDGIFQIKLKRKNF